TPSGIVARGATRRPFRINSEADSPAAGAHFNARTSSSRRRTVVEMRRATLSVHDHPCLQRSVRNGLRQSEDVESIRRHDRDELLAVLTPVDHGVRVAVSLHLVSPEFFAGLRIEGAETPVVRRADENQASGGDRRAGAATVSRILLAFGKPFGQPEAHFPSDIA